MTFSEKLERRYRITAGVCGVGFAVAIISFLLREPDGSLNGVRAGEVVFWQTVKPQGPSRRERKVTTPAVGGWPAVSPYRRTDLVC